MPARTLRPHRGAPRQLAKIHPPDSPIGTRSSAPSVDPGPGMEAGCLLLADRSAGELGDDVELSEMTGVLLDQMEQDAFERCRLGALLARAWSAHRGQVVGLDDGSAASNPCLESRDEILHRFGRGDVPPSVPLVAPRFCDGAPREAPFEPAQLDERDVLEQLYRCPSRWQATAALLRLIQALHLGYDAAAKVVEIVHEHLGP